MGWIAELAQTEIAGIRLKIMQKACIFYQKAVLFW